MKTLLAAMLINADHAAPKDGEIAPSGIDTDHHVGLAIEIGVFLTRMIDLAMVGELFANFGVLVGFVGYQMGLTRGVGADDGARSSPFPGADLIFSSLCGAVSGRLATFLASGADGVRRGREAAASLLREATRSGKGAAKGRMGCGKQVWFVVGPL